MSSRYDAETSFAETHGEVGSAMRVLRTSLVLSTALIYAVTVVAIWNDGWLWPVVAFEDLTALNWRSQFDVDFLIYLMLSSAWIVWREGGTTKAYVYGFLNIFLGGMFGFPYLLIETYRARGDVREILLGVNAPRSRGDLT